MQHFMGRDGGDYAAGARQPGGFQFAEDTVLLPLHIGTHIDALCHAWYDDALYNGFPGSGTRSTTGAARCGIDKMGPIAGRGVLLDIAGLYGEPLADGVSIGAADLERAARQADVRVGKGDIVQLHPFLQHVLGPEHRPHRRRKHGILGEDRRDDLELAFDVRNADLVRLVVPFVRNRCELANRKQANAGRQLRRLIVTFSMVTDATN